MNSINWRNLDSPVNRIRLLEYYFVNKNNLLCIEKHLYYYSFSLSSC